MKYFRCAFVSILCLAIMTPCNALAFRTTQAPPPEQQAPSKDLDRQIDNLARQIISSLDVRKTHKIAIVEFTSLEGKTSDLGKYLAEELTTRLFRTGRFQIVERQLLQKMMDEQQLSASGLVDAQTASKFGQILGVDALTTGTIADLNTSVKINARLIAVQTGSVFAVASASVPMTREVETLLKKTTGEPAAVDKKRFDGTWDATLVCPRTKDGVFGYAYQFVATVKDGIFHGEHGSPDKSPHFSFDGTIKPDGSSIITASGVTGDPKFAVRGVKRNTPVIYHIETIFSGSKAAGKRLEIRECSLTCYKR